MRSVICYNNKAVTNVFGYALSISIAFTVMSSALLISTSIIDSKKNDVAELQAQSIANQVVDSIVDATLILQSTPDADYEKTLAIPDNIAGKDYYVEVTDFVVYVNTTDGAVSKSCTNYVSGDLNIGVAGKVNCGNDLKISYKKSEYVYKLDFGVGNITNHSAVRSGYLLVSNTSNAWPNIMYPSREPEWKDDDTNPNNEFHWRYRIPIFINASELPAEDDGLSSGYSNYMVKVVLNSANFAKL